MKYINNKELENKIIEASKSIWRGIIFSASIYIN